MKQKTINQNKLQAILCAVALIIGVLVSAVLFSMPTVHAEGIVNSSYSFSWKQTYYCENYYDQEYSCSITVPFENIFAACNNYDSDKKTYILAYFDSEKNQIIQFQDYKKFTSWDFVLIDRINTNNSGSYHNDITHYSIGFNEGYENYSGHQVMREWSASFPVFKSWNDAFNFYKNNDKSGLINGDIFDTIDETYTFTGFSINGKTARWTGTTERSYLKDQEVEEYTTITYAWATTTEPNNIGEFQTYNGEFPTSDKQLKLPWSDMESGKVDFQFIRQVNVVPCYRVPGAFYHGQAVKIFFKSDGSIEKISDPNVFGVLDESIPIPILSVDNDQGTFTFVNAQNNYKFELKGRFWSTDDFYVYRNTPSLVWQYKYLTLLKNSLTTWVSVGDNMSVLSTYKFSDLGSDSWNDLLNTYPIEQRNIITGQEQGWFSWANITGYNDAVTTLKTLLNSPYSLFNGYEIYVRYYITDEDGTIKYSKWTHYFNNLADADGSTGSIIDDSGNMNNGSQSDKGLTDNDLNNVENSGNSRNDVDAKPSSDFGSLDIGDISGIFNQFLNVLKGLYSGMGQLPSFITSIFGFLPNWVSTMIGLSIVVIIILRIIGR